MSRELPPRDAILAMVRREAGIDTTGLIEAMLTAGTCMASEGTIRRHLARLVDEGLLEFTEEAFRYGGYSGARIRRWRVTENLGTEP